MVGRQLAPGPGALGGPVWAQGRSLTRRPLRSRHGGRGAGSAHVLGPRWAGRAAVSVGQGETGAPRRSPARRLCPAGAPSLACEVSRSAVLAGGSLSAAPSWFRVTLLRLRTRGPSGLAILLPVNKAGGEPAAWCQLCPCSAFSLSSVLRLPHQGVTASEAHSSDLLLRRRLAISEGPVWCSRPRPPKAGAVRSSARARRGAQQCAGQTQPLPLAAPPAGPAFGFGAVDAGCRPVPDTLVVRVFTAECQGSEFWFDPSSRHPVTLFCPCQSAPYL